MAPLNKTLRLLVSRPAGRWKWVSLLLIISSQTWGIDPARASGPSLNSDCEPKGLISIAKAKLDPKSFWAKQIEEIQSYVEGRKTAYRLYILDNKRQDLNARLDDEEMRILGVTPYGDPKLEQLLKEANGFSDAMQKEMLAQEIAWGRKCTSYANVKLSQIP
jgi:hypothetical protein